MCESLSSTSSPDAEARAAAVVVAGGSGRRMAQDERGLRKQYLELAGEPILLWAVRAFVEHPRIAVTVVVLPADDLADPPRWLLDRPVVLVAGGNERGDSVRNGLAAVPDGIDLVLIHDGARPLVSRSVVDRVLGAAAAGGVVPAVRATDTLKEVDENGQVVNTLERARIWHVQTPQRFPLSLIRQVHQSARREGWTGTDDASLCERYGVPVQVVEGSHENLKITRPVDLVVAEALARSLRAG